VPPGRANGFLDDGTLGWLDGVLDSSTPETPVFVCFHHPPVRLHSPFIDEIRQHGEQRLADVLARYPQVVAAGVRTRPHTGGEHVRRAAVAGRAGCGVHAQTALGAR
jgi:hypothetical protein